MLQFTQVTMHQHGFIEPLLAGLDFTLTAGDSLTLLGPPGSGRSTAIALVAGGVRTSSGSVWLDGRDPTTLRGPALASHRATMGIVPQRGGLLSNLTLADNITLPLRYHQHANAADTAAALKDLLRLFEIEDPPPIQASHATATWRWIAALGRALILKPKLLLVDDLGEELDALDRDDLWRLLWRVRTERGLTVLATTSDPAAAAALGDRTLVLPGRRPASFRLLRASSLVLHPYSPAVSLDPS